MDIFFVLSGYLITRLIARELSAGTFSFRRFYIRRAWRLFPALLLMLAAVVVWTLLLAPAAGRSMVAGTIAHSVVYIENWNIVGTEAVGNLQFPEDPAAHTWSLSVEEQSTCWAALPGRSVAVGGASSRPRRRGDRRPAGVERASPFAAHGGTGGRIYFSSDTRADQLLIGCTLALALECGWRSRLPRRTAPLALVALLWLGLAPLRLDFQMTATAVIGAVLVASLVTHGFRPLAAPHAMARRPLVRDLPLHPRSASSSSTRSIRPSVLGCSSRFLPRLCSSPTSPTASGKSHFAPMDASERDKRSRRDATLPLALTDGRETGRDRPPPSRSSLARSSAGRHRAADVHLP